MIKEYNILFKLPSRSRPYRVFEVLDATINNLVGENFKFLLSLDEDDDTMNNDEVIKKLEDYPNMKIVWGSSDSKIHAVNRDLDEYDEDWDIVVLLSDDMVPVVNGFDNKIREAFEKHFPDLDGVTWFSDGYQKNRLNTLCILGEKYYDRFGYIYHPDYKSWYADNEFTIVANALKKQVYFENVIIEHRHYVIGNNKDRYDELYKKNDLFAHADLEIFKKRLNNKFDLVA